MVLRWLLPLGFVGLVSIAILLAIYILKPQYKEKRVSGTVIWKRVVLQSKKHRPRLSNLLIFLVQAFVLTLISVGFAEPRLYSKDVLAADSEYVIVLDASASMRARSYGSGDTRFSRAKSRAKDEINELFSKADDGVVSLILAENKPSYIFSNLNKNSKNEIFAMLDALDCSLEESNLEAALKLAGSRLESNPYAKIFLCTDIVVSGLGTAVELINVSDKANEQNIAILGCDVGRRENEFVFELVLGAYGNIVRKCDVSVDISGTNNKNLPQTLHLDVPVAFAVDENDPSLEQIKRVTVVATNEEYGGKEEWLFDSYDEVKISIPGLNDSISDDDTYLVFGGVRDTIKTEYWSLDANGFWQYGFNNLSNNMSKNRDISFREIYQEQGKKAENSGFDFYIFEHSIPSEVLQAGLPDDGVILLVDPDEALNDADIGITFNENVTLESLTACTGTNHPLIKYMDASKIHLTKYSKLTVDENSGFEPLLFVDGDPVLLIKDTPDAKFVVMPFSINMSDFYTDQFQIFLYNLVNYFMPVTLQSYDFNLGDTVRFDCKGETLQVACDGGTQSFSEFPSEMTLDNLGTYTFTVNFGLNKPKEVRKAYVHISSAESKLFEQSELMLNLNNQELTVENGRDFFIWLAVIALILIMVEWFMQFKYIL